MIFTISTGARFLPATVPIFYRVSYMSGGAGFLPSTVGVVGAL